MISLEPSGGDRERPLIATADGNPAKLSISERRAELTFNPRWQNPFPLIPLNREPHGVDDSDSKVDEIIVYGKRETNAQLVLGGATITGVEISAGPDHVSFATTNLRQLREAIAQSKECQVWLPEEETILALAKERGCIPQPPNALPNQWFLEREVSSADVALIYCHQPEIQPSTSLEVSRPSDHPWETCASKIELPETRRLPPITVRTPPHRVAWLKHPLEQWRDSDGEPGPIGKTPDGPIIVLSNGRSTLLYYCHSTGWLELELGMTPWQ